MQEKNRRKDEYTYIYNTHHLFMIRRITPSALCPEKNKKNK